MTLQVRQIGRSNGPAVLCLAGFGDNSSMFDPLISTELAGTHVILAADLPGFGAPRVPETPATLDFCADLVDELCRAEEATIVLAHSVASIIASLAAGRPGSPITTIVSLEGNLTADDAYFSGSAAAYDDPQAFRTAFLDRLNGLAAEDPILGRYRDAVAEADPLALWELGCDARRFSEAFVPGNVLADSVARVLYLYNPANCPEATVEWLEREVVARTILESASHWPTVDQPDVIAAEILRFCNPATPE